jgi:hypothetical protein
VLTLSFEAGKGTTTTTGVLKSSAETSKSIKKKSDTQCRKNTTLINTVLEGSKIATEVSH